MNKHKGPRIFIGILSHGAHQVAATAIIGRAMSQSQPEICGI